MKSILALEHKTVLPNIKFNKPNPKSKHALAGNLGVILTFLKQFNGKAGSEFQLIRPRGRKTAVSVSVSTV